MHIIQVRLENGVFVPLEPVEMTDDQEAVVILFAEKRHDPVSEVIDYSTMAREYFQENFPALEVKESIIELVGTVPQVKADCGRREYHNYLEKKYND